MCAWHLRHSTLNHCSSSMSHAGCHPWGSCKSHWSIQLWPACHGPSGWWSVGHLYDHRLTTDPAGRPHPASGDCKDAGWDLGPIPVQSFWFTWALAAPLGMQPHQADPGCPVQKSLAKGVPEGTVLVGIARCTQGDHPGRLPWWDQPHRPQKNAQPNLQPFLQAPNGCAGEGVCWEMLPLCHLQGKTAEGSHGKYCSYPSPGDSAHWLPVPGAREGKEENVLVVTDHFTQYAQAYVTQLQMAQTMAKVLWDNFIIHFGLLQNILSDQGRNIESELIADLCRLTGTKKLRTSPYHPKQMASAGGSTPP